MEGMGLENWTRVETGKGVSKEVESVKSRFQWPCWVCTAKSKGGMEAAEAGKAMEFTARRASDWMVLVRLWREEEGKEMAMVERGEKKHTIDDASRHVELALMIANH